MRDVLIYHQVLEFYCKATRVEVNELKSSIMFHRTMLGQHNFIKAILPFQEAYFNMGLKYSGFHLKEMNMGLMDGYGYVANLKVKYPLGIPYGSPLEEY
jgi:hypothetical protein